MPTLYVLRGPDKGQMFQAPDGPAVVGRQSEHIPLTDDAVSREHAVMRPDGNRWILEDLNSSNGTYVNGQLIHDPTTLKRGDQIKVGATLLVFRDDESVERFSGPTATHNLVEYAGPTGSAEGTDSSILYAVPSSEESVILATPETADAVHAWKLMYQIAETTGTIVDVEDLLERITDLVCDRFVFDRALLLMGDPDDEEFAPQVVRCRAVKKGEHLKVTASRTIINHVRKTKNGILCADAMTDQRFASDDKTSSIHGLRMRNVLCVPIVAHDEVRGIIHLDCAMAEHKYTHEQLRLVTAIGRMTGLAIDNAQLLQSRMRNERLAATGETVAYLAHHIRNILQGLHSGSDVLEMGLKQENLETIRSAWTIIQRNLDRTLRLATDMLTFSKDRQPTVEAVQLNKLIEDVISLAQRNADEKRVALGTDFSEIPPTFLDKEGIHQVILNLVLNAIDACPQSGGRVVVKTAYDSQHTTGIASVSDNGSGIDVEELAHIFEPFRSTKGQGGTGLGLAAARKIAHENNGELTVDSAPGQGATFTLTIPAGRTQILNATRTNGSPQAGAES